MDWSKNTLLQLPTPPGWEIFFDTVETDILPPISEKILEFANDTEIYPPMDAVYSIFNKLKPSDIKVVILGQDPYIKPGQAVGMSFSVPDSFKPPPSLKNIYKELAAEGYESYTNRKTGDLTDWVEKGVFLYNCCLTVNKGKSDSHKNLWKDFTNLLIDYLNQFDNIAWILLGKKAQQYSTRIDTTRHKIFAAGHPSPLNRLRDFAGSNVFIDTQTYLNDNDIDFDWD